MTLCRLVSLLTVADARACFLAHDTRAHIARVHLEPNLIEANADNVRAVADELAALYVEAFV